MLDRIKLWLVAAGAFLVALGGAYWRGRSTEAAAAERERLEGYADTRKRMDEVGIDDTGASRRWLHERGQR